MSTTEHILLESDVRDIPDIRAAHKVHVRINVGSRLRKRVVQLEIIDYYYLAVRIWHSRSTHAEYVLDLRSVDASPVLSRHIAWWWMTAAFVLLAPAAALVVQIGSGVARWWQHDWLPWCGSLMTAGALAMVACVCTTSESVALFSDHGRAKLLEFTGGLGTFRAVRIFRAKLSAHIQIAKAARGSSRTAQLRDEMREHFRLRGIGVLSAGEYEAAKARILGQHSIRRR